MLTTLELATGLQRLLLQQTGQAKRAALAVLQSILTDQALDDTAKRALITEVFPELVTPFISDAGELAAQVVQEQLDDLTVSGRHPFTAVTADLPPAEQLAGTGRWLLTQAALDAALEGSLQRLIFGHVAATVADNVDDFNAIHGDTVGYARWMRHASANACGFCRMIATRHIGHKATFYGSEEAASGVIGRTPGLTLGDRRAIAAGTATRAQLVQMRTRYSSQREATKAGTLVGSLKKGRPRGSQEVGEKYHDHCRCTAILIPPGVTPEVAPYVHEWNDDYLAARKEGLRDPSDIAKFMDNAPTGKTTQRRAAKMAAPKSAARKPKPASGSGGPPQPPRTPPRLAAGGSTPEPPWSGHTRGYRHPHRQPVWSELERQKRQRRLGIPLHGDQMYQHEIESVERMQALGHRLQWIPRNPPKSTNDAVWLNFDGQGRDIEIDLKSTSASQGSINARITDCFKRAEKARARGEEAAVKENFVIDIGDMELKRALRMQLEKYNSSRRGNVPKRELHRLWVLSQGNLIEIELL